MINAKSYARGRANYLLRIGAILKPTVCGRCGKTALLEKHHRDYSRPDDIEWICRPCHAAMRRNHVARGVAMAAVVFFIMVLMISCAATDKLDQAAAEAGTTVPAVMNSGAQTLGSFLPEPWREILIGAVGLAGIVYQTLTKRRLQKKLQG